MRCATSSSIQLLMLLPPETIYQEYQDTNTRGRVGILRNFTIFECVFFIAKNLILAQ